MTPKLRLVGRALVASIASACAAPPPHEVAHTAAPEPSSAPVEVAEPEAPPTTFAGVAKLLARAEGEPEPARKLSHAVARKALALLTNEAGRPAILAQVKTERGTEEARLLPQNRKVETLSWRGGMHVAGERVARLGDRLVSIQDGRVTIWGEEPTRITSEAATSLEVPTGEPRFALVRGKGTAFVLDSETGKASHEGNDERALLLRSAGSTRLAHVDAKKHYEIVELPSGKAVASWPSLIAVDPVRGLAAVSGTNVSDAGAVTATLEVVRLADGSQLASRSYTLEKFLERTMAGAKLSPDGRSIATIDSLNAWRIHLAPPRDERLQRASSELPPRELAFTADGKHVCVDAPGPASPRAAGVPGTTQRCYVVDGVAHVASLPAPPPRMRRAHREDFTPNGFGHDTEYETMSADGALVASLLYDGKPFPIFPQRFAVAVVEASTGKQLWSQFCGTELNSLLDPPGLSFSSDSAYLLVDGVRVDARTGAQVDGKPVALASLLPVFERFGLEPGRGQLTLMRLGQELPFFERNSLVWTADLAPRPLSVFLDPTTLTVALRVNGSRLALTLASGATSALALLPDGSFAASGAGSDLVCEFGEVLAPFDVCRGRGEIPAARVAPAFVELAR